MDCLLSLWPTSNALSGRLYTCIVPFVVTMYTIYGCVINRRSLCAQTSQCALSVCENLTTCSCIEYCPAFAVLCGNALGRPIVPPGYPPLPFGFACHLSPFPALHGPSPMVAKPDKF